MGWLDVALLLLAGAWLVAALVWLLRRKKRGCSGCCTDCSACCGKRK